MLRKRPFGVMIFGAILIFSSIFELYHIPSYSDYKFINKEFPSNIIVFRFIVSYILRVFGLVSGIGVVLLSNNFRKILLGLSFFSISTIYLRHTYKGFLLYVEPLYYQNHVTDFSLQTFTWMAVLVSWTIEVGFSSAVIYYFTRPGVVKTFLKEVL